MNMLPGAVLGGAREPDFAVVTKPPLVLDAESYLGDAMAHGVAVWLSLCMS